MKAALDRVYEFIDRVAKTNLSDEFFEMSDAAWEKKERLDAPGLADEKPDAHDEKKLEHVALCTCSSYTGCTRQRVGRRPRQA